MVTPAMAIHGALMLTAWALLIPAGGVVARYYKVMPGQDFPRVFDNLTWWNWHRGLQYGGLAMATVALILILAETGGRIDTPAWRLRARPHGAGLASDAVGLAAGQPRRPERTRRRPRRSRDLAR